MRVLLLAVLAWAGFAGAARPAQPQCPSGTVAVEDVASGQVKCEREDAIGSRPSSSPPGFPGAPPAPEQPAAPAAPGAPQAPAQIPSSQADCGLSRWGCEEACNRTHLAQSLASAAAAAQRAKVELGACLRVCGQEFPCEPRAPEVPLR